MAFSGPQLAFWDLEWPFRDRVALSRTKSERAKKGPNNWDLRMALIGLISGPLTTMSGPLTTMSGLLGTKYFGLKSVL